MPVLLPFRAFRSSPPTLHIPGQDAPHAFADGSVVQDQKAGLFVYRQRFRFPGEVSESFRDGVMGLLNREEATVFPHEQTLAEGVAASQQSLQSVDNDPGSLWLWCNDPADELASLLQREHPPEIQATDRFGCVHEIWPVTDTERICELQAALEGKDLFLADGHHRFAAGWNLATIQVRNSALRTLPYAHEKVFREEIAIDEIERDARRGVLLTPKSTDFFPKLAAGLVIYRHSE